MQLTYEVELDYGDEGPDEGDATPTGTDMENAVIRGLEELGFPEVDVVARLK